MSNLDFDYNPFFGDIESTEILSCQSTTSPTNEIDFNSIQSNTPPMITGFDDTVIDFDNLDFPLEENGIDEFGDFTKFLGEENYKSPDESSTFEALFASTDSPEQTIQEQTPNMQSPCYHQYETITSSVPKIINCIKLQPMTSMTTNGSKSMKIQTSHANPTIKIIKTTKPLAVVGTPVIHLSSSKQDESITDRNQLTPPMAKRRRSDSPSPSTHSSTISSLPTVTLEQLKAQYSNANEDTLKKHLRMIKNRESASLSRKRRKELMETLVSKVKSLTEENEDLKKENTKLINNIQLLKIENELLKRNSMVPKKSIMLMGIVLLVVFNLFTWRSFIPVSEVPNSISYFNTERAVVPSRALRSYSENQATKVYLNRDDHDYESKTDQSSSDIPSYPYIQCVAYINKTHSKRINQDLRSLIQENIPNNPEIIEESNSLTIPSKPSLSMTTTSDLSSESGTLSRNHLSRKSTLRHPKLSRTFPDSNSQLEPYRRFETHYDDFIHSIDRKNDTLYFVSFKRDHLIFPATSQNQTHRPKMSLILPASMANLNKSIHIPSNHIPMIKIDCEVEDTKLVFIKQTHIPSSYRHDLLQYYSSGSQATI